MTHLALAALKTTIEHVAQPTLVVAPSLRVVLFNRLGGSILAREPGLAGEVVTAIARSSSSKRIQSISNLPLSRFGPPHRLVLLVADEPSRNCGCLHATARGKKLNPSETSALQIRNACSAAAKVVSLTDAETRVFVRVARGDANKEIASSFGCSPRTVEVHVTSLLKKCGVGSRSQLIAWLWSR